MADKPIKLSLKTPLGRRRLALRAIYGRERVSRLFRYELEMDAKQSEIDFGQVVGQPATVTVETADGEGRYVDGIVSRFAQKGRNAKGRTAYRAQLVPRLWLLGMSSDCRVFQAMSIPEIVAAVLDEHGVTDYELRLSATYPARDFCVQYNETALRFVSRRLEEAGIFYFFEHRDGGHTLVLGDDPAAFTAAAGEALGDGEAVQGSALEEMVIPGGAALDDFNFETPSTDLVVMAQSQVAHDGGQRQLFEYPGGYAQKGPGEDLAEIRLQERETPRLRLRGRSGAVELASGRGFELAGHYRADANGAWVVERMTCTASRNGYESRFAAVSATAAYRPARVTPRPVIAGAQTAVVVGQAGEEIWTDGYGRVKVQFHWDRRGKLDEDSSCWVRVSQAWAGKGWGQLLLPRIGQEVIVGFEEGDPDRPVILGRLYNAEQSPPLALPDERTRSTLRGNSSKGGGADANELLFEDAAGAEEVTLHGRRDLRLDATGDLVVEAGGSITLVVGETRLTLDGDAIRLAAPVIELAAGQSLELRSKATARLEAASAATVDAGSTLDLEAGATLTIRGALVKLN